MVVEALDKNPSRNEACSLNTESPWPGKKSSMVNGGDDGEEQPSKDGQSLFQVMKAVEAAENIIKQQYEENTALKTELESKMCELERYKTVASVAINSPADGSKGKLNSEEPYKTHQLATPVGDWEDKIKWTENSSTVDRQNVIVSHENVMSRNEHPATQNSTESQYFSKNNKFGGVMRALTGGERGLDNVRFSQVSPCSRSLAPSSDQVGGESDPNFSSVGYGVMQMSDVNNQRSLLKQDLTKKVIEHEEEIAQLRRHLAEYSVKELQMRNEKFVLQKRIAYMRQAFDQQQQELVDAASKALSYRQDVIEENIRLSYALQVAEQERSIFASSLVPLLAEYNLQPTIADAQSIVNNLKFLFKHLKEKLIITEDKLKESQYQLTPGSFDVLTNLNFASQSTSPYFSAAVKTSTTRADWESQGHHSQNNDIAGVTSKTLDHDNLGRTYPFASRKHVAQDIQNQNLVAQNDSYVKVGEEKNIPIVLNDVINNNGVDKSDTPGLQNPRELTAQLGSRGSPYLANDDPNSSVFPYLQPVLEEPSSSFSEAADDDPLPAIKDLQIAGEAFPGRLLQACGYSINGTTSCNFEWVRYLEDGSVNYISGAKQPIYLVTADDVDYYLAIEVQPLDVRKRKGELIKVFANDHRKITCDPEMQEQIEKTLSVGHTSFEVQLSAGCLDIWEPAVLAIRREGYSIKCSGSRGVVVTEKFSQSMTLQVTIPYEQATEFSILSSSGTEYLLRTLDSSSLRDTIVLTLRLFIIRAIEKRKGKKKGLFFIR